jgi:cobalt/nickel transport system permease protein
MYTKEFENDPCGAFDPRCRLAAGFTFIVAVLHVTDLFLLAALVSAITLVLVRDIKTVLPRLGPVNIFCAALFITMPLSGYGLASPLLYTLRVNAAALLSMVFVVPLGIGRLGSTLTKLRVNPKLVSLLFLSYRYLFIMHDRIFRALLSMRLRRPRQATLAAWRSYTALFASAFAAAFFRSQKISRAAQARGFNGAFPLTRVFRWKTRDTLALITAFAASILLVYIDRNLPPGLPWRI